jgi:hypothetical protein
MKTLPALGGEARKLGHDINNLVAGMKGYAEILLSHFSQEPVLLDWLVQVNEASAKIVGVTHQLSQFVQSRSLSTSEEAAERKVWAQYFQTAAAEIARCCQPLSSQQAVIIVAVPTDLEEKYQRMSTNIFDFLIKINELQKKLAELI